MHSVRIHRESSRGETRPLPLLHAVSHMLSADLRRACTRALGRMHPRFPTAT